MDEWIKTTEILPKPSKNKQWEIYMKNGKRAIAWYSKLGFYVGFTRFENVTHYKELSPPPLLF